MAVVYNRKTGRSDANHPTDMKHIRSPVFVDNCAHHAIYSKHKGTKKGKVSPSTHEEFQITSERTYVAIEEESAVRLVHNQTPGHSYTGDVFFNDRKLSTDAIIPSILYGSEDESQRLVGEKVESTSLGSRLILQNMRGQSLMGIGFDESTVRLGQEIDIGLRTTDLAMRLAEPVSDLLTGVNIADDKKVASDYEERVKHSQKFLSQDFRGVNLVTALRFVGRHDGRILYSDKWGSLRYVPFRRGGGERLVRAYLSIGDQKSDTNEDSPNRITVLGKRRGFNHVTSVTMDDRSSQEAKDGSETIREGPPISDPSVKNISTARKVARQILRSNQAAKGRISQSGLIDVWDVRAGDIVRYEDYNGTIFLVVSEATHSMADKKSTLEFLAISTGVEGVLQGITESAMALNELTEDMTVQLKKEDLSLFSQFEIRSTLFATFRFVAKSGKRIGDNAASIIGRKPQTGYQPATATTGESAGSNKEKRYRVKVDS